MIAGYDYMILRDGMRRFWTRTRIAGATLVLTGGVLIGVGAAYYGYASSARADLDKYNVSAVELVPIMVEKPSPPPLVLSSPSIIPEHSLYSGDSGFIPVESEYVLPDGFVLIDFSEEDALYPVAAATSITIPSLDIQASVSELSIQDLGDRRAYETPDSAAGHIPETSNAGENGDGWYFGHMESPLLGEGSVFNNLDQVPDLLIAGEDVQVVTDNGTEQFLYRVTGTRVVHEDDIRLDGDGKPDIHLVSCFPRLVYDHRLIVDATLIGKKTTS